jgi:TrmH family RNA methyltransferase
LLSSSNARLAAARRLTRRSGRRAAGRFLAEGAQAVRAAIAADAVLQLFATDDAIFRHPDLAAGVSVVSAKDAAALSETVTPQGLVAVCRMRLSGVEELLARSPRLLVVMVEAGEPGNVGTIIRTADAAGADAVMLAGGADPFSGKAVRASSGSLFHLPLAETTAWLFGSEAHGLPPEVIAGADRSVRVPLYGGAESLNVAAAAAVCLYASARAQRRPARG